MDPYNIGLSDYGNALSAGTSGATIASSDPYNIMGSGSGENPYSLGVLSAGATSPNIFQQSSGLGAIAGGVGDIFGGLMGAGQQVLSSPNALMGLAGGLLTKEAYDRLSDIGEQMIVGTTIDGQRVPGAMEIAERGQAESQFKPFTVTTPTGAMFTTRMGGEQPVTTMPVTSPGGFAPSPTAPPSMALPPGMGMDQLMMQRTGEMIGRPMAMGQVAQPAVMPRTGEEGLQVGMQLSPQEQALQQQLLGGAGGFFGQAAQPTMDREQAIFERIRAAQRPEEERQRLAMEERLAAQGRLGTSSAAYGGATPELLALSTAEREARDRSMLTAMQQAQAEQAQQATLGGQFLGAGYLPTQQLIEATRPGLIQQELAQQAQQFGTGLFGETALSGLEAQLIAEQARANLLGGVGSNVISGLINQQRAASAAPSGSGGSSLGGLFSTVASGLGEIGTGIKDLLKI